VTRPTDEQAAAMIASMNPEAYAAWQAVLPMIGEDSNKFVAALVEAACVTAIVAGVTPENFAKGVKAIWDDRAVEFSGAKYRSH
jgi:hypothetical protein